MQTALAAAPVLTLAVALAALGLSRATHYRRLRPVAVVSRKPSPRALSSDEQRVVLGVLDEPRFVDLAPAQVYATLLDEKRYLCSERTMYRILAANQQVRERRDQVRHPRYVAPELLRAGANELRLETSRD